MGCTVARPNYGAAYLVLQNVEDRVTYSFGDSGDIGNQHRGSSGGGRVALAVGVWVCRLLKGMSDQDLQLLDGLSRGEVPYGEGCLSKYLEFQVHGPVRFREDAAALCLPRRLRGDPVVAPLVQQFSAKYDVFVDWYPEA